MCLVNCMWCYEQLANYGASVFLRRPPHQAIARRPCRRPPAHSARHGGAGEANAALAEGREEGGEGTGDEGFSFGIAYGFL